MKMFMAPVSDNWEEEIREVDLNPKPLDEEKMLKKYVKACNRFEKKQARKKVKKNEQSEYIASALKVLSLRSSEQKKRDEEAFQKWFETLRSAAEKVNAAFIKKYILPEEGGENDLER